jgi:DNA processing protein
MLMGFVQGGLTYGAGGSMTSEEAAAWLIINDSGLSATLQRRLAEACGSAQGVLGAETSALLQVEGVESVHVGKLRHSQAEFDLAAARETLTRQSGRLVSCLDADYPPRLRELEDRPALLFVQGTLTRDDDLAVALVGTRQATPYGLQTARRLARDLAQRGFTIVSGLARGIDAEAHEGAVEAGGRTIAVMGTGLDITYPREHESLREKVAGAGAVITELALGMRPTRYAFPARNRIIAGLCRGVLIVEAPLQSGALITADLAADYGREVFAVPGRIDSPCSRGCHKLIKDGAGVVEVAEDVVEGLGLALAAVPSRPDRDRISLSTGEQQVYDALTPEAQRVDQIVEATALAPAQVNANLMLLEMKGLARRFAGGGFVRVQ